MRKTKPIFSVSLAAALCLSCFSIKAIALSNTSSSPHLIPGIPPKFATDLKDKGMLIKPKYDIDRKMLITVVPNIDQGIFANNLGPAERNHK